MLAWQIVKKYFDIAYRPSRQGMQYEQIPGGGTTKTVVESLSAVLVLYASYSELSEKVLKAVSLEQSYYASATVRLVTCLVGIVVCLHILFARKAGTSTTFEYPRIPRLFAGIIIWLVLLSAGITVYDLISQPRPSLEVHSGSYELPATECIAKADSRAAETAAVRTYECRLAIPPGYKDQYRGLKVFIVPTGDFRLKNVTPIAKEQIVIPQSQGPLEVGNLQDIRSSWEFPQFDPNKDWKMLITLDKINLMDRFPDQPPLRITVYFYK